MNSRITTGGVAHIAKFIEQDLQLRDTPLYKKHIEGIADIAASIIVSKSCNSGDIIPIIPRKCDAKSKERYISRILSNELIKVPEVMNGYIPDLMTIQKNNDRTVVLMLDQTKIADNFECLMISMQAGERAIPVLWKARKTEGSIGFNVQQKLLDEVKEMIPNGTKILLLADRFYGTENLVSWCKQNKWSYRIRLKKNLIFIEDGGEITCEEMVKTGVKSAINLYFNNANCTTNIGILWEDGHKEPWIIAMDCKPSEYSILDYGMRWGIECMFSDFKSRGFGITKTHLQHDERIERLILILTIALYWCVSSGMQPTSEKTKHSKKNYQDQPLLSSKKD
jgi:hypothetical protein